jgi:uncharacterized protein
LYFQTIDGINYCMVKRPFFGNEPDWMLFLISLVIYLGSVAVFFAISLVVAIPIFQMSVSEIMEALQNSTAPQNMPLLKYFQTLQSIGIFIVPSLLIGFLVTREPGTYLRTNRPLDLTLVVLAIFSIVAVLPFVNLLAYLNQNLDLPASMEGIENWIREKESNAEEITKAFLEVDTWKGLLFNILMVAILPSIGEEMAFRGVIQKQLIKLTKNRHVGIMLASVIFSAVHFQFYGFLPRLVLGLFLGYLFWWTQNLWYPILAHFINNGLAVIFYYHVNQRGPAEFDLEHLGGTMDTFIYAFISLGATASLLYLFYSVAKVNRCRT